MVLFGTNFVRNKKQSIKKSAKFNARLAIFMHILVRCRKNPREVNNYSDYSPLDKIRNPNIY